MAGYIERGETDKDYDWVTQFEADTGCKVNVKTAGTSDEMVSLMTQGGYDLVTASGDASLRLIRGSTVQPVDISRSAALRQRRSTRLQGSAVALRRRQALRRAVPVGPERADVQHQGVQEGADVVVAWCSSEQKLPDGKSNKGRVQAYDGPIYIADAALYLMTKKPDLGIKDPYELNEAQYTAVLELLRKQHPLVQRYWHDANVQVQDFTNEGVVASGSWPFQVNTLIANKQPIASTVPAEGATGWADTTMLHASAKHPNCAYKWLEWSINAKVQGDVAAWFGSVPVGARRPAKATSCSAPRAARPTASTTSTRSSSGARRKRSARRRATLRAVQPLGDRLRRGDGRPVAHPVEARLRAPTRS